MSVKRRSGNAFVQYMELLGWEPSHVTMVGVGGHFDEVFVMREKWGRDFALIGFEPSKNAYQAAFNNFPGILFQEAIWSESGSRTLYEKARWVNGSSLFENKDGGKWKSYKIKTRTLDQHASLKAVAKPHGALWLDCEGAELHALQGASSYIRLVDVVNVEMTTFGRGEGWCTPREVHEWLVDHGFLQMFIHTIRSVIGQYDSIYVRDTIYNPEISHCHL